MIFIQEVSEGVDIVCAYNMSKFTLFKEVLLSLTRINFYIRFAIPKLFLRGGGGGDLLIYEAVGSILDRFSFSNIYVFLCLNGQRIVRFFAVFLEILLGPFLK